MNYKQDVFDILKRVLSPKEISESSNLADIGFDSIAQIEFTVAIEEKYSIIVEPETIKNWKTISDIFNFFEVANV